MESRKNRKGRGRETEGKEEEFRKQKKKILNRYW